MKNILVRNILKLFLIAMLFPLFVRAQQDSTSGSFIFSARFHYGFIIAHRPSIVPLQQAHLGGVEISISKSTAGHKEWHQLYCYPQIGLKYCFFGTGDAEQLGNAYALIPYMDIIFGKQKKINFGMQFGWGIGYVEKVFDRYANYKEVAIGSHLNGAININFNFKYRLSEKNYLYSGIGLTHFSNGSIVTPNLGINIATAQIAYSIATGKKQKIIKQNLSPFEKKFRKSFLVAGAIKQNYPVGRKYFYAGIISGALLKQYSRKAAAGLGLDITYDDAVKDKLERRGTEVNAFTSGFRPGINASYEVIISDLSIMFQQGFYLYTQLKDDGNLYHRIGIRYQFSKDFFGCINLKTHFAKADYFEWGVGMRL